MREYRCFSLKILSNFELCVKSELSIVNVQPSLVRFNDARSLKHESYERVVFCFLYRVIRNILRNRSIIYEHWLFQIEMYL